MADSAYYLRALEALTGVSESQSGWGGPNISGLGAAANRLNGNSNYNAGQFGDVADIRFPAYQPNFGAVNRSLADIWQTVRRGSETYHFSSATDAQGRYHAAVEARANQTVASFAGDPEDVREVRRRILQGESLDSILTDVRERRNDMNLAAAVAHNNSKATATAHNDIRNPWHEESRAVAQARDGSAATSSAGSLSQASSDATRQSTAGASADGSSKANAQAHDRSQTAVGAFEQSRGFGRATDQSEATVSAQNGSTAKAKADMSGVSRSEANNDSRASSRSRSGEAHAEARNGSAATADSAQKEHQKKLLDFQVGKDTGTVWGALRKAGYTNKQIVEGDLVSKTAVDNNLKNPNLVRDGQKLHIERPAGQRPNSEAVASNGSSATALAHGKKSDAGAIADHGTRNTVQTGPGQHEVIKTAPPRQ
jgi:hypothetical protein